MDYSLHFPHCISRVHFLNYIFLSIFTYLANSFIAWNMFIYFQLEWILRGHTISEEFLLQKENSGLSFGGTKARFAT